MVLQSSINHASAEFILKLIRTTGRPLQRDDYLALYHACSHGYATIIIEKPLSNANFKTELVNFAFGHACEHGQTDILTLMIPGFDRRTLPSTRRREMFYGTLDAIKVLLADDRTRPFFSWKSVTWTRNTFDYMLGIAPSTPGSDLQSALQSATYQKRMEFVRKLIFDYGVDPVCLNHASIPAASRAGDADLVKRLLLDPRVDPCGGEWERGGAAIHETSAHSYVEGLCDALTRASGSGRINVVKILLENGHGDPSAHYNMALRKACAENKIDVVIRLLKDPRFDPGARNNEALQQASKQASSRLEQILLADPRANPRANGNYAVKIACRKRRKSVLAALLVHERTDRDAHSPSTSESRSDSSEVFSEESSEPEEDSDE
ncbi:hypothetical protein HDU88_008314 [Geranomyces variabilis]|nr:hypothetical protein HDU88_008314 [Geranomyces variabilis]